MSSAALPTSVSEGVMDFETKVATVVSVKPGGTRGSYYLVNKRT